MYNQLRNDANSLNCYDSEEFSVAALALCLPHSIQLVITIILFTMSIIQSSKTLTYE
jgi:hypothetical protein